MEEEGHIYRIIDAKSGENKTVLLDLMRKGGLLANCLRDGLAEAYERVEMSTTSDAMELRPSIKKTINSLDQFIQDAQSRLEMCYRDQLRVTSDIPTRLHIGTEAEIAFTSSGQDLQVRTTLKTLRECSSAFLALSGMIDHTFRTPPPDRRGFFEPP